jgi:hypothetical protein
MTSAAGCGPRRSFARYACTSGDNGPHPAVPSYGGAIAMYAHRALQLELGAHVVTVDEANERLMDALAIRCDAHRRRCDHGSMTVHEDLTALRWVRAVEDELEPIREAAGYTWSRAAELCTVRSDGFKSAAGYRGWAR